MYVLYLVTNLVNNKVYVGQTVRSLRSRWAQHLRDAAKGLDTYFARAIRKYGRESFVATEILKASTQEEVNERETLWILLLKSHDQEFGYNSTLGGECRIPTEDVKQRIGLASKALWSDPEFKARSLAARSPEASAGENNGMFGVTGEAHPRFGKQHSDATKEKIRQRAVARFKDPAAREFISKTNTGRKWTPERKAAASIALAGNQYRKGKPHSEEVKARIRDGGRKAWEKRRQASLPI